MVDGWKPVVLPVELFEKIQEGYEEKKEDLKLRHGVRSLTGYVGYLLRIAMRKEGIL